jgi:hypothetical protein
VIVAVESKMPAPVNRKELSGGEAGWQTHTQQRIKARRLTFKAAARRGGNNAITDRTSRFSRKRSPSWDAIRASQAPFDPGISLSTVRFFLEAFTFVLDPASGSKRE